MANNLWDYYTVYILLFFYNSFQYSIDYDGTAETEGFVDVTNATLGASPVTLIVPIAATATSYNANLTVRNSTTGCVSQNNAFTITVNPLPVPTISGNDTTCVGSVELYETETGMTNYTWNITSGSGTITPPGDTYDATIIWGDVSGQYEDRTISVNYTDSNNCSAASATEMTIRVFRVPETGPQYHIPNEFNEWWGRKKDGRRKMEDGRWKNDECDENGREEK